MIPTDRNLNVKAFGNEDSGDTSQRKSVGIRNQASPYV